MADIYIYIYINVHIKFTINNNIHIYIIIYYIADGETISIDRKKKENFEQKVLPKYFQHSNMATFVRQLNNYGFKKSAKDSSKLEFENEFFIRSQPQNYWKIFRKK